MYAIFIILLQNYEKTIHVHNYRFSGRECVLIILFRLYCSKAGHFESNLFWLGQYDPILHIGRTNQLLT